MTLPNINKVHLQQAAFSCELRGAFPSWDALCKAIVATPWGEDSGLSASSMGELLIAYATIVKTPKPLKAVPVPAEKEKPKPVTKQKPAEPATEEEPAMEEPATEEEPAVVVPKPKKVKKDKTAKEPITVGSGFVLVPAGKCPIQLKGMDEKEVREWVDGVQADFASRKEQIGLEGLKYFLRNFYDINSKEYRMALKVLEKVALA